METIHFWNGNKSIARQSYETELLESCLSVTNKEYGPSNLLVDNTDYPLAEDESNVFETGSDILVTVAGNVKFEHKQKIVIPTPLNKGLLGYRLLIVTDESLEKFKSLKTKAQLQALSIGIPETWADAEMFRQNNHKVVEKGTFEDLFTLLKNKAFDYTSLGANEIEKAFTQYAEPLGGLNIEPTIMIYYPFPLLFYVNLNKPLLADRVEAGLKAIMTSGEHDKIFSKHHGDVVNRLNMQKRTIFTLQNPFLPKSLANFKPTLFDQG